MRIIELEKRSGLDRATIRYYEKEGMIHPVRQDNGYRNYSEEELLNLKKIKLLRQLGMPLNKIQQLQQGSDDFHESLEAQIRSLEQQQQQAVLSAQVCRQMQEDSVTYATMDPDIYLEKLTAKHLDAPNAAKPTILNNTLFKEFVPRPYHPFRHFLARCADMIMLSASIYFLQAVIFRMGLESKIFGAFSILLLLIYIPIEAALYHVCATTPGKLLFGIRVMQVDGCKLSPEAALSRAFRVYRFGLGWGIPIWSIYRLWKSLQLYDTNENCWNDESEIIYTNYGKKQYIAWILAIALTAGSIAAANHMIDLPQNSGDDLTVAQFAENYNNYRELLYPNSLSTMQPDGTFVNRNSGNVVIVGEGEKLSSDNFAYIYQDGKLMGFTAEYETLGSTVLDLLPTKFHLGAVALFTSIEGMGAKDTQDFAEMLESKIRNVSIPNGTVIVETEQYILTFYLVIKNCKPISLPEMDGQLFLTDSSYETYVKMTMTMEIK